MSRNEVNLAGPDDELVINAPDGGTVTVTVSGKVQVDTIISTNTSARDGNQPQTTFKIIGAGAGN